MRRVDRLVPYLFALYALATCLFLILVLPPFMGPDEINHVRRAGLLSHGRLVGERFEADGRLLSGGPVDGALSAAVLPFSEIPFQPWVKATPHAFAAGGAVHWNGEAAPEAFENTSFLPPLLALPASLSIVAGKALDLPVLDTLRLARLANALACIAIGTAALAIAGTAAPAMMTLLLLPMATFLFAVISQDGMIIAVTALAGALILRARAQARAMTRAELWAAAGCLALVGMVKLPYAMLGLLLAGVRGPDRRTPVVAALLTMATGVGWGIATMAWVQVPQPIAGADALGQAAWLIGHPWAVITIAIDTLRRDGLVYAMQFVGVLGWLDTLLPMRFYGVAAVGLLLAAAACCLPAWTPAGWSRLAPATAAALLLATALLFGGLYAVWTPVGAGVVEGIQGRYFLPFAMLALLLVQRDPEAVPPRWARAATWLLLVLPLLSLAVVARAVLLRYY